MNGSGWTQKPSGSVHSPVGRSITAAGVKIETKNAASMRRLIQPWQDRALSYYDLVGECWFASQFYGRSLAQIRLFVGTMDEEGQVEEVEGPNDATALLDRIRDPGGTGRTHLQASYGRLMFITGEGYLTVTQPEGEEERWEFLSSDELRVSSNNAYVRYIAPSLAAVELQGVPDDQYVPLDGDQAAVYRLWRKHPRYSSLADAPMRAVLDLFEELLLLQLAVLSRVKSRLSAAGLLIIPEEITLVSQDSQTADEDMTEDPLLNQLIGAAQAAIQEPGTAAAVIPVILRAQGEWIEKVRHLQFFDPGQAYPETGLRMEVIKRIAMGLDLPPEILLGMSDANHWTSWQIDEQTAKAHIFPICQQFVDDLTSAYLRPAARDEGIDGWENLVVGYDPAALLVAPDRAKDAATMFSLGELSGESLREAGGFSSDEDEPTEEERWRYLGAKIGDASLAMYGIPRLNSQSELETAPGVIDAGTESPDSGTPPSAPVKGPPPAMPEASPVVAASGPRDDLLARVLGAAEFAVIRSRSLAGARLRTSAKKIPEFTAMIEKLPNGSVAAALNIQNVHALGHSEAGLVKGASAELADVLTIMGIDPALADAIGTQVERHAAQTLYLEVAPPLPDGFAAMLNGKP